MDYEQGSFGPASVEMQDTYLQMDAIVSEFLEFVEKKFGMDQVLIFLTANTSASYPAQYLKENYHIPVDNFLPENAHALLTSYLNITYGEENWIEYSEDLQIYLNHEAIKKNKIDLIDIREDAANFINQFEGVHIAMTAHQLEQNFSADGILSTMFNSYAKNRSGDILFLLKEGWTPKFKFKNVNYTDQSHIPLLFYGKGVPSQTIGTNIDATSLAPTLCELLHIPRPDKSKGTSFANAFSR
jgi:arylsulfatase A-like enzyme